MGDDPGRGGRSDERPLATVHQLHLDAPHPSDAWYENERLAGQLTGRAPSAPPADRPASAQSEAPVVLGWRHAEADVAPVTVRDRLGRTLAQRRPPRRRRGPQDGDPASTQAREARRAVAAAAGQVEPPALEHHDDTSASDDIVPVASSGPRIGFRESGQPAAHQPKRPSPWAPALGRVRRLRLRGGVIVAAVVVMIAAVAVISVVSGTSSTVARPRPAGLAAAASRPASTGLGVADAAAIAAARARGHSPANRQPQRRAIHARRRARQASRSRHIVRRSLSVSPSQTAPAVTTPASTPSASSSSSGSTAATSSYGGSSSSSPAYSTQSVISQPTVTVTRSVPLPAGPSEPGGTVGSNCNPSCS